jgi:hypothetical protein
MIPNPSYTSLKNASIGSVEVIRPSTTLTNVKRHCTLCKGYSDSLIVVSDRYLNKETNGDCHLIKFGNSSEYFTN